MAAKLQSQGWLAGAWGGAGQGAENPKNQKNQKIQIFKHIQSWIILPNYIQSWIIWPNSAFKHGCQAAEPGLAGWSLGRGWAGGRKSKKSKKSKNPNLQTHTKLNYFTKLHTKLNYLTEFSLQTWLPSCRAGAGWLELGAGLGRGLKIQKIQKIQKSKSSNT